jgi:hypothetical protein
VLVNKKRLRFLIWFVRVNAILLVIALIVLLILVLRGG